MKKYIVAFWPIYVLTVAVFVFLASAFSRTVTVMSENAPVVRKNIVVIDAGHGGEDGGATSCSGRLESQINLEIALRINDLCHLLGYETIMIRTSDISVYTEGNTIAAKKASDLRHRVSVVNTTDNSILVSIHQNTFSDSRYSGAQVFYARTTGSKKLAQEMQKQLAAIDPNNKRQAKEASGVYLLQHISKPAVLVECGFLSNPEEEAKLRSELYQKKLCCVIVCALCEYINA